MDKRVQKTRTAIQNAYICLLLEKNTTKITVTELAKKANIDRKTFYLHYETTDAVLRDYNQQLIHKLLELLEQQYFFSQNFRTDILYSTLNQVISEHLEFFRHAATVSQFDSFWEESKEAIVQGISKRYQNKILDLYGRFALAGMMEVYREWLKGNLHFSMEELGRLTSEAIFHGIEPAFKPQLTKERSV